MTKQLSIQQIEIPELELNSLVGALPAHDIQVTTETLTREVDNIFYQNPELPGIIVTRSGGLYGMISRPGFLKHLSRLHGVALFRDRPIRYLLELEETSPLVQDAGERIDQVFRRAFARVAEQMYEPVVIRGAAESLRLLDVKVLLLSVSQILVLQNDELHRTKESLIEAEKMALLSQLVAGVAHEINTPLGITLTAASHLAEKTKMLDRLFAEGGLKRNDFQAFLKTAGETTELMLSNSKRAADLIRSFKQVAVDQACDQRRRFNLHEYLHKIILNLGPKLKKTPHRITVECPEEIELDSFPGSFSQIITNLAVNSLAHAYAEDQAGHILIKAGEKPEGKLVIEYSDDGRGIPPELHKRIFEPFFTTNRHNGGSGLGLHIVYNIVTQTLHGEIRICNLNRGCRFMISLPLETNTAAEQEKACTISNLTRMEY